MDEPMHIWTNHMHWNYPYQFPHRRVFPVHHHDHHGLHRDYHELHLLRVCYAAEYVEHLAEGQPYHGLQAEMCKFSGLFCVPPISTTYPL